LSDSSWPLSQPANTVTLNLSTLNSQSSHFLSKQGVYFERWARVVFPEENRYWQRLLPLMWRVQPFHVLRTSFVTILWMTALLQLVIESHHFLVCFKHQPKLTITVLQNVWNRKQNPTLFNFLDCDSFESFSC
jgi:hypothetical protein